MDAHEPHLIPLLPASALYREKALVQRAGQARQCAAGFDPTPALRAIAERARREGLGDLAADFLPELCFEQDFAVLDGSTGRVPWLCVCVPSHWTPEEKLGLTLGEIHTPVADSVALHAATAGLIKLATSGECWERFVWTLTPSNRYDQHPLRHRRAPWSDTHDIDALAQSCYLRSERQTFFPVPGCRQAVFTIKVELEPLTSSVSAAPAAQRLHDSLHSMTEAALAYKGLTPVRARLLRWLAKRF